MEMKRVVIVGGGVAGAVLAKSLQFSADVILIDTKEYFEIPWANLRSMVEPSFSERTLIKHTDYLNIGRVVTSRAISINDKEVLTEDGRTFTYDYLVIATGHADSVPKNIKDRLGEFQQDNEKIKSSNSILIIGGGPTGVELAAEIAVDFPQKKVTLVHRGPRLLEFIGQKASNKTLHWLTSRKVEVLLNQAVNLDSDSESSGVYTTSSGEKIAADSKFLCVGKKLGSSWLQETILKDCIDKRGQLMVDEHFRVKGWKNIFAIGDITNVPEIKEGYLAQKHATVVEKNIKLLMKGANENKLAKYKPSSSSLAIVSLGRKEGIAQLPFTTISGCLPGIIKSKDLYVGKTRKIMGLDHNHKYHLKSKTAGSCFDCKPFKEEARYVLVKMMLTSSQKIWVI